VVARVAGRLEWGVRVTIDERAAMERARDTAPRAVSGAAFLQRKKSLHDAARRLAGDARARGEEIFSELAAQADDARRRPPLEAPAAARLLLDAAYLVPAARAARFRGAVRALARRLVGGGYQVTLTGPWPPYNFVAAP
jgi:hypothetical protein